MNRGEKILAAVLAAVVLTALLLCAGMWSRHRGELDTLAQINAEAASYETEYNDTVARKTALEEELSSLEAQERELNQRIEDADRLTDRAFQQVQKMEEYFSREAAASEEAWRLERETASIEASLGD